MKVHIKFMIKSEKYVSDSVRYVLLVASNGTRVHKIYGWISSFFKGRSV